MATVSARVFNADRLASVRATGLLDTGAEEPFDRLAALAATLLDAPFAFITVVDDTRSFWKSCIGVEARTLEERQNAVEESFCQYVVGSREPLIVGDTSADERTRDNPSISKMGVAAWAGFPLFAPDNQILGTFCVVDTVRREWTERDVEVLRTLSLAAAGEVALRGALEEQRRHAEQSDAIVRTLQETLLPPHLPEVAGIDVAAEYRPAGRDGELSGDFYDFFESGWGGWNVVLGDVCGKGIEAAKMTALVRYTVRAAAMRARRPSAVLQQLNDAIRQQRAKTTPIRFCTALLAHVRHKEGQCRLVLCSGGHGLALLVRPDGEVVELQLPGTVLGAVPDPFLGDVELTLAAGDALVFYTDGITDARNGSDRFGEDRLKAVLALSGGLTSAAIARAIQEAVGRFAPGPLDDDAAVVVLKVPS